MNTIDNRKIVRIEQIANRNEAFRHVLFRSGEEMTGRAFWMAVVKGSSPYARCGVKVIDNTPDMDNEEEKRYTVLFGLKYLHAACMLELDRIPVTVLGDTGDLDMNVVTAFFNADFCSLTEYEKGVFIRDLIRDRQISVNELARRSGCSFGTLQSLLSAINAASAHAVLEDAYRFGLVGSYIVRHTKKFFDMTASENHRFLMDYILKYKRHAVYQLWRAVVSREDMTIPEALNAEIAADGKEASIKDGSAGPGKSDGRSDLSSDPVSEPADGRCSRMRAACSLRYNELMALLGDEFVLDFETALSLPDRARFSYALPGKLNGKYKRKMDKKNRRLFCRIVEFLQKTGSGYSESRILMAAYDMTFDSRFQHAFAALFRFNILYRNRKAKLSGKS